MRRRPRSPWARVVHDPVSPIVVLPVTAHVFEHTPTRSAIVSGRANDRRRMGSPGTAGVSL
jgi:hypothetical protein